MYFDTYGFEKQIKEITLKWDLDAEDKIKIVTKLKKIKTFSRVFNPKFNLTDDFYNHTVKYGNARTNHFIYTVKGRTGSGKSSIGAIILYWLYKDKIDLSNVVFSHHDQKRLLKKSNKNNTIMRDEQTVRVGLGSNAESLEIQNWDETLRRDGINFIYIAPTDRFHGTAHKNLEFVAMSRYKRISLFALYDGLEHGKYYTGFVLFNVPTQKWWRENGNSFWTKYNRKKDKFNEKTRADSHGINWKDFIDEIKEHKDYKQGLSMNQLKAIVVDLYIFQPKDFRDTILTIFLAKNPISRVKIKIPTKPDKCSSCGKDNMRYSRKDSAWKCNVCYTFLGID